MAIKRKRELSVFSVSAIDLFASGLGAFLLITAVILPFYPNVDTVVAPLRSNYISAALIFKTECVDVDLHVLEDGPHGSFHTYFNDKAPGGRTPGLTLDQLEGPGTEIWEISESAANTRYRFGVSYYGFSEEPDCQQLLADGAPEVQFELRLYHTAGFTKTGTVTYPFGPEGERAYYIVELITESSEEFTISPIPDGLGPVDIELQGVVDSREPNQ